jgi:excisionase family DNA binding protein
VVVKGKNNMTTKRTQGKSQASHKTDEVTSQGISDIARKTNFPASHPTPQKPVQSEGHSQPLPSVARLRAMQTATPAVTAVPKDIAEQIAAFPGALNAKQVARIFGISAAMVYKLARSGVLPCFRIGTNMRFAQKDLVDWYRKH